MTTQERFTKQDQWYFVRFDHGEFGSLPWRQVSVDEFIRAERAAGFHPKGGGDGVATGGFGGANGQQGRVVSPYFTTPESYDWDPEFQAVLTEAMEQP
jgi:hypothetical protein